MTPETKNMKYGGGMSAAMAIDFPLSNSTSHAETRGESSQARSESYSTQQWLTEYLAIWKAWQRRGDARLGYPSRAAGLCSGYVSKSFDEFCEELDVAIAHAMDAIIEHELPPAQRAAIYKAQLYAVFRFPRDNYQASLEAAHEAISAGMRRKGFA